MWNNLNHQFIIPNSKCNNHLIVLGFKANRRFCNYNLLQFYSSHIAVQFNSSYSGKQALRMIMQLLCICVIADLYDTLLLH